MDIEQWARARRKILIEGRSKRSVMKEEGLHWETLQKMLAHSQPPGYRRVKGRERKIDAYRDWVVLVLDSDREVPRKQRHSAKRIFDRLRSERGYGGGYTAVKELVAELKAVKREVFVPLTHRPGEAQVVRTILIEDMSRLARDSMVQQLLLAKLADLGIALINCSTGANVTADVAENPMLKAMIQIQGVFAELEKANLVGKLRHARESKKAALGKCEGAKAYGEVDQAEKETLALMRSLRRKRGGKVMSYARIAAELNARGIAPRRGKRWHATTVSNILNRKPPKAAA